MRKAMIKINKRDAKDLITILEEAENKARRAGLFISMRAINAAKNALGWEYAGNTDMAVKYVGGPELDPARRVDGLDYLKKMNDSSLDG